LDIEKEQLKLRLIETQMALLQYQHREVLSNIEQLTKGENEQLSEPS
jgi:hypothetical protein